MAGKIVVGDCIYQETGENQIFILIQDDGEEWQFGSVRCKTLEEAFESLDKSWPKNQIVPLSEILGALADSEQGIFDPKKNGKVL